VPLWSSQRGLQSAPAAGDILRSRSGMTSALQGKRSAACLKPQRSRTRERRGKVRGDLLLRTRCGVGHSALVRLRRRPHGGVEVPVRRKFTRLWPKATASWQHGVGSCRRWTTRP